MPYFYDVTPDGETRAHPNGPFNSEAEAEAAKSQHETDRPDDTIGEVYEAAADHASTFPQATMIVGRDGADFQVFSDGTEEAVA